MNASTKKKLLNRIKRAEGQLGAVHRMVDDEAYCVDTLTQISAVQGAMDKVGQILLRYHIENCVTDACSSGDERERQKSIDELMEVFARHGGIAH
jgi:DNA-binding FrmR family transcriptional regulator